MQPPIAPSAEPDAQHAWRIASDSAWRASGGPFLAFWWAVVSRASSLTVGSGPVATTGKSYVAPPQGPDPTAPPWSPATDWLAVEGSTPYADYIRSKQYQGIDRWLIPGHAECEADQVGCVQRFLRWYLFVVVGAADPLGTVLVSGCKEGDFLCGMAMGNLRVGAGVAWGGVKTGASAVASGATDAVGNAMVGFGDGTGLSTRPASLSAAREAPGSGTPGAQPQSATLGTSSLPANLGRTYPNGTVIADPQIQAVGFQGSRSSNPFHALDRAIERGVAPGDILTTLSKPTVVLDQGGGYYLYLSSRGAVAIRGDGEIVTIWGASETNALNNSIIAEAGGS